MPITSSPDHVAVAVPDIAAAARRWRDQLGAGWAGPLLRSEEAGFATRQLRYRGGAKLELLEPVGTESFAAAFVGRFGARIHHVTLKVPALLPAVEVLREEGYDVVDVFAEGDVWHEAFLRPSQVGGMIVQVAWAGRTDERWAELAGERIESPADDAAILLGPTLHHPDLAAAARLWRTLGAEVTDVAHVATVEQQPAVLHVSWPDAPLDVRIERHDTAGAHALRFRDVGALAADTVAGPPTTRA